MRLRPITADRARPLRILSPVEAGKSPPQSL
jgi:hypothetical protein